MPKEKTFEEWEAKIQATGISKVWKFEPQGFGFLLSPIDWIAIRSRSQQTEDHHAIDIDVYLDDCVIKSKTPSTEINQN